MILRRIRGALGMAVLWGLIWTLCSFLAGNLSWLVQEHRAGYWSSVGPVSLVGGFWGLWGGLSFALLLTAIHHRRQLGELDARRVAPLGAVAGVITPLLLVGLATPLGVPFGAAEVIFLFLLMAGLGAGVAAGLVHLGRGSAPGGEERGTLSPLPHHGERWGMEGQDPARRSGFIA